MCFASCSCTFSYVLVVIGLHGLLDSIMYGLLYISIQQLGWSNPV
jgi:hypothetical protein